MTASLFTAVFVAALVASLAVGLWLAQRQIAHVRRHREQVPAAFAGRIAPTAHRKAADYTVARTRFGRIEALFDAAVLLALTLGGVLAWLVGATADLVVHPVLQDLALVAFVALATGALGLPFSWYRTFHIESRFGFNRTTPALWLADLAKGTAVAALLGLPLVALVVWLMRAAGTWWWLYAWLAWIAFQALVLALYPTVIAPLFNKFSPLPEGPARDAVLRLLDRCGFRSSGLYIMDGSRRSSHGNAFFTGFGRSKRIVFFDTLLARLAVDEIEAVLAHELGHFRLRHVLKRMLWMAATSLALLALLAFLQHASWFYAGLGIPATAATRPGATLLLFFLVLPVFTFLFAPIASLYSRKHEFEADAFAARHASSSSLVRALVTLYEDNAATLTPDPLHSAFYDSHPPAAVRIARLEALAPADGDLPATAAA